jgi:hypothetical protein
LSFSFCYLFVFSKIYLSDKLISWLVKQFSKHYFKIGLHSPGKLLTYYKINSCFFAEGDVNATIKGEIATSKSYLLWSWEKSKKTYPAKTQRAQSIFFSVLSAFVGKV